MRFLDELPPYKGVVLEGLRVSVKEQPRNLTSAAGANWSIRVIALRASSSTIEDPTGKVSRRMSRNKGVPAALVTALLAAGIAGPNAIDDLNGSPDARKPNTRAGQGSGGVMPPSREVALWALKQLSDLASDRNVSLDRERVVVVWKD